MKKQIEMTTDELQKFFEDNEFIVNLETQANEICAELEKWTDGGVDMIIFLSPFTAEEFVDYVNAFDVDEEIDLHRESKDYRDNFTTRQSVEDFETFETYLRNVASQLVNMGLK